MKNDAVISLFTRLSDHLASFGRDCRTAEVVGQACAANEWFSHDSVCFAVEAIRQRMLDADALACWLEGYGSPCRRPLDVCVIMAGNIPLVGFFDLMCVVASGHNALVKPSSKDSVLISYICECMKEIMPEVAISPYCNGPVDAVIATGSDNTNRYFRSRFGDTPSLMRGHRSSMAVLSGHETDEQLRLLGRDAFMYNGLGCRNISLMAVPQGYDIERLASAILPSCFALTGAGYRNNYRQTKALMMLEGDDVTDCGGFLLNRSDSFPTALSCIDFFEYGSLSEIESFVATNDAAIQCIETSCMSHSRGVDFGCAQMPGLTDYPDGKDVMEFLHTI